MKKIVFVLLPTISYINVAPSSLHFSTLASYNLPGLSGFKFIIWTVALCLTYNFCCLKHPFSTSVSDMTSVATVSGSGMNNCMDHCLVTQDCGWIYLPPYPPTFLFIWCPALISYCAVFFYMQEPTKNKKYKKNLPFIFRLIRHLLDIELVTLSDRTPPPQGKMHKSLNVALSFYWAHWLNVAALLL